MQFEYANAQNLKDLIKIIEHSNWLDTATYSTRILAIKELLVEDKGYDTNEWVKTDTSKKVIIGDDAKYRQGSYETEYSKSNLQKKMWIIECIIARKLLEEKYILNNKSKNILLDYTNGNDTNIKITKSKKEVNKIYLVYKKYFSNFNDKIQVIKSPIQNSKYSWINPYSN